MKDIMRYIGFLYCAMSVLWLVFYLDNKAPIMYVFVPGVLSSISVMLLGWLNLLKKKDENYTKDRTIT